MEKKVVIVEKEIYNIDIDDIRNFLVIINKKCRKPKVAN